ncbi:hypothetical protein AAFF_G00135720 [Aldrovandia affinis]|uniref:Uncharacterized protein n=1 Tax=Aldrovandia affinis TaxID=143900 RepID=A0AAD7RPT9_9TELE|nr:hypothetical protein AAFF_G00135720 [Aldrovandia affinis]
MEYQRVIKERKMIASQKEDIFVEAFGRSVTSDELWSAIPLKRRLRGAPATPDCARSRFHAAQMPTQARRVRDVETEPSPKEQMDEADEPD